MRTQLTCALLALAAAAQAALPSSGLPSGDFPIAAHVSAETFNATKLGRAFNLANETDAENAATNRKVRERLGIDLSKDVRDLTLQARPSAGDQVAAHYCGLLRGRFDKAKIESFAASRQVPSRPVAGLKAWEGDRLVKAVLDDTEPDNSKDSGEFYVVILDGSTLLFADEPLLAEAVAAAKANLPWKHAGLSQAAAAASNSWLVLAADVLAIEKLGAADKPDSKPSGAKTANLSVGESATDMQVRVNVAFVSEAKAKEALTQLQGLLGFAQLGLMPNPEDSPEDAKRKQDTLQLVQSLKVSGEGTGLRASLDYPVDKAVVALLNAVAEAKASAKAQGAAAPAPKGK